MQTTHITARTRLAALLLAASALTACSADGAGVTAPTQQVELSTRERSSATTQASADNRGSSAAPASSTPSRSGFLLSTGRDDEQ